MCMVAFEVWSINRLFFIFGVNKQTIEASNPCKSIVSESDSETDSRLVGEVTDAQPFKHTQDHSQCSDGDLFVCAAVVGRLWL